MQVPRYFRPQNSFFRVPGSRGLVDSPFPTPWRKPHCCKYSLPRISRYCYWLQILAALLSSRPPTPFLWCLTLAGLYRKRHGSFIVLAVRVYRLGYPLSAKLEKTQRISPSAFDCVWFQYICCSIKFFCQEHNF